MTSTTDAPTQLIQTSRQTYAYRRLGHGPSHPLLCLQHFTGTLDNWDPALIDGLATSREVILFDNAGIGRSGGTVPETVAGMAEHAFAFLEAIGITSCDVLGYSLGGMIAQQVALDHPAIFRRIILAATAPRGGEDIMHVEKPSLARYFRDPTLDGYARLRNLFFAPTAASQAAGAAFVTRLQKRTDDLDPRSGPAVAAAQIAAFREWEHSTEPRFEYLKSVPHPVLVANGLHDAMIPIANSYRLFENLPNATLIAYPDAGHGAIFQFHAAFVRLVDEFLNAN